MHLVLITLKNQYSDDDKIKDLFKFSGDTFKNVPNGINIFNQFGTADFRRGIVQLLWFRGAAPLWRVRPLGGSSAKQTGSQTG